MTAEPRRGWLASWRATRTDFRGFDDAERELLIGATAEIPTLRAIIERAERRADLDSMWRVKSNVEELDEMYSLVQALMGGTRGRRKLDLLDGMLATLCASMDGF